MVKERSVSFGSGVRLAGIISEASQPPAGRPACILLNAGVVHRVGPNRLYVRLARELAVAGHHVLRFDLSGRGDSDVRSDGLPFLESSVAEVRDAMDYLAATRGACTFILLGICSGAGNAFQAALADPRVVGAVMVDVHAYPTLGFYLRHYARRLGSPESWRNTLSGENDLGRKFRWVLGRRPRPLGHERSAPVEPGSREPDGLIPPKEETARALETIIDRGVRLLLIFSGTWRAFNYRNQFRDAFPALYHRGASQVEYFPDADHTFSHLYNQQRLMETVTAWVTAQWPVAGRLEAAVTQDPQTPAL